MVNMVNLITADDGHRTRTPGTRDVPGITGEEEGGYTNETGRGMYVCGRQKTVWYSI